jgi:hypothetical protein
MDGQLPNNPAEDSEYEEIAYEEVDRVCASLEELRDAVESLNIQVYLDEAINNINNLVYEEADDDDQQILPFADAA